MHSPTTEEPKLSENEVKTLSLPRVSPNWGGAGVLHDWCIILDFLSASVPQRACNYRQTIPAQEKSQNKEQKQK